jgi:UDP-GlcNAc:undecaprenyl-phosphate/decaprenyl-phosphate GlcNAc-1-phosphate transferase
MLYLTVFVVCLMVSLVSTWSVRNLANTKGWTHQPKAERHMHTIPVPRLGGVAIYGTFLVVVMGALAVPKLVGANPLLPAKATLGLLGPAMVVFLLGLRDDVRPVSPYWKLLVQGLAAVWLYAGGFEIHNLGLIYGGQTLRWTYALPLTVLWVLLITNAFNLIDGLDGLAAGSALFSTAVLFVLSLVASNPLVTFLTIALAGATLGFLRFNFHPATIFLGDSGSLFIGFTLAALALAGSQKAPTMVAVAIPVVSLGLPILDVALAVMRRFVAGKPLFSADKQHIHHKLVKLGLSQREAVLILYAVTAGFGFLSLILLQGRSTIALVLAVTGIGIFVGVQQLRYQEFAELLSVLQRVTRRRQILANHVAIRRAIELLNECEEFRSICSVLRETLQPIGFDGIRLQILNPNGFAASSFQPLSCVADGNLHFHWSDCEVGEPSWELRLELVTSSREKWGYLSLMRMSDTEPLHLDVNVLTEEFRTSVSDAIDRACAQLEAQDGVHEVKTHKLAAGSMAD